MGEIDADVLKGRAGVSGDVCGTIIFKPGKHVGLEIVLHEVDVAFFKFEHAHQGVGHDLENHAGQRRPFVPIIRIALERDLFARLHCLQSEGSGTGGRSIIGGTFGDRVRRYDSLRELLHERRMRRSKVKSQLISAALFDCPQRF